MLISNDEAAKRLNSPMNLFNQMRTSSFSQQKSRAMNLFGVGKKKDGPFDNGTMTTAPDIQEGAAVVGSQSKAEEVIIPSLVLDKEDSVNIDSILDNAESKIKLETVHNIALDAMVSSIQRLKDTLVEVSKPEKLADIAVKMGKVVNDIRTEKNRAGNDRPVHLHFYTPEQRKISEYQEVTV